jgi:hypothetical protein
MGRLAACLVFLCAAPASAASYMEGTWFGQGQLNDPAGMYIDRMHPDGSWRGEYRTCIKGKPPLDQSKTGRWSMQGDLLILKVETVDGKKVETADGKDSYTDPYRMLAHSAKNQKYVSVMSNFVFTPQRMADDFQMPSCDLVS